MWVLDHLDDLDADFRAFYRIDDFMSLDGPRFFKLATRVSAFSGVMAARFAAEQQNQSPQPQTQRAPQTQQSSDRKVVPSTRMDLAMAAPGMFEFSKAEKKD